MTTSHLLQLTFWICLAFATGYYGVQVAQDVWQSVSHLLIR